MKEVRQYLEEENNLPDFMKDFHDQKDLFKTIWEWWGKDIEEKHNLNWVTAMTFTIDNFLWFMGIHGYKLQKDRSKNIEFRDIDKSINEVMELKRANFAKMLTIEKESK